VPHDAFGNKIEEAPLAGLDRATASGPSGMPGGEPPRRWPALLAVLLAVAVIGGVAAAGATLLAGDDDPGDPVPTAVAEAPVPEAPADPERPPAPEKPATPERPVAEKPVQPPRGLQPGSLLRRANFTVALRRLRAQAKGRPRNLRVEAERIDVQVVLRDGRLRSAQARWDGEIRVISTTSTPIGALPSFAWSAVDRGAPQRIVRSATGRARKPASAFNYAVLLDAAGLRWSAFLKTGEGFIATSSGRVERQISGP
jgi:hypothetical protein